MKTGTRGRGTAASMTKGLLTGMGVSFLLILLCSIVIAKLLDIEVISWDAAGYCIMGMLMAASISGTLVSCGIIKRKRMQVSLAYGIILWVTLTVVTALFFGGQYHGIWVTACLIISSSITGGLIGIHSEKPKRRKKAVALRG